MTALTLWLDDSFQKHADFEAALDAIEQSPTDIDECWVRDPEFQRVRVYSAEELADELRIRETDLASEKRHNQSLAAE